MSIFSVNFANNLESKTVLGFDTPLRVFCPLKGLVYNCPSVISEISLLNVIDGSMLTTIWRDVFEVNRIVVAELNFIELLYINSGAKVK